jgi:BlaI family transcriptional regulator, penicillinase repressor
MARSKSSTLTSREAEIMSVLWDVEDATSEDIRRRLSGDPHDSTVRTLLRVLSEKGQITVDSGVRPMRYRAAIGKRRVRKKALGEILRNFFAGSPEDLVMQLLDDERLSPEQLRQLERKYRRQSSPGEK